VNIFQHPPRGTHDLPLLVGFLLLPQFSMIAFAAAIEPLRSANRMSGKELYRWKLYTRDGAPVVATNGITITPDAAMEDAEPLPVLIVCAGYRGGQFKDPKAFNWLRRQSRKGTSIGAISTGVFVLAAAGLLNGQRCSLHWEYREIFAEAFPAVEATTELFVTEGNCFTCAGGTAALDMMLQLVKRQHGRNVALLISEQFLHGQMREHTAPQRTDLRLRLNTPHAKLLRAVALMEAHIENPLACTDLARKVSLSSRQLERVFRQELGASPARFYLSRRLERARQLLRQTTFSVLEVAVSCGFSSTASFSRSYQRQFNRQPSRDRIA
jgi:transcriptional regulator GlxA family with amidase domain